MKGWERDRGRVFKELKGRGLGRRELGASVPLLGRARGRSRGRRGVGPCHTLMRREGGKERACDPAAFSMAVETQPTQLLQTMPGTESCASAEIKTAGERNEYRGWINVRESEQHAVENGHARSRGEDCCPQASRCRKRRRLASLEPGPPHATSPSRAGGRRSRSPPRLRVRKGRGVVLVSRRHTVGTT